MARWMTYLKERFPLPVYLILVSGLTLSGSGIALTPPLFTPALAFSFAACFLFFAELRLMDELKDYDKDCTAHPERPLPRGLLSIGEVARAITAGYALLLAIAFAIAFLGNWSAGLSLAATAVYLWLMYREFYIGRALSRSPLLYALSHQAILLLLCSFALTTVHPELAISRLNLWFGLLILGSFFAYEVCRKLDPKAPEILQTYLFTYGPARTAVLVTAVTALAAFAAGKLALAPWLWPVEGALILSLALLFFRPEKFKLVEGIASLSLVAHMWAGVLRYWWLR